MPSPRTTRTTCAPRWRASWSRRSSAWVRRIRSWAPRNAGNSRKDGSGCAKSDASRASALGAILQVALDPARVGLLEACELAVCLFNLALGAQLFDEGVPGLGRLLERRRPDPGRCGRLGYPLGRRSAGRHGDFFGAPATAGHHDVARVLGILVVG